MSALPVSEADFLDVVERVVIRLRSFLRPFGPHSRDDLDQMIRLWCWKAVTSGQYDAGRQLEPFLMQTCRRRTMNLWRDNIRRIDSPCLSCRAGTPCQDGEACERHKAFVARNQAKANLNRLLDIDHVDDEQESNMRTQSDVVESAEANELAEIIDTRLPVDLRADYLRMLEGGTRCGLPCERRRKVQDAIRDILDDIGATVPDERGPACWGEQEEEAAGQVAGAVYGTVA